MDDAAHRRAEPHRPQGRDQGEASEGPSHLDGSAVPPATAAFERHVLEGLARTQRALSSRWFYDDGGSQLFRRIMALPSYYPTRAEHEILERHARPIVTACGGDRLLVVDLGAGDASKTQLLLEAARATGVDATYAPIDVSEGALASARSGLAAVMPDQHVTPVLGDYRAGLSELAERAPGVPRLVLFLGSNIGNLEHDAAVELLASIADGLQPWDRLLVGYDLMKDPARLRAAYDDADGVTAAFNLNLLTRINRELGGDFDVRHFRHVATLDLRRPAMESWIVSTARQTVHVAGRAFELAPWEAIHTEISCKYGDELLSHFARGARLTEAARFTDERRDFVDVLYRPGAAGSHAGAVAVT